MEKVSVKVKRNEENPEAVEVIAQAIIDLSRGATKILSGRLNRKAIVLLLQSACGTTQISRWQVELMLDNLKELEKLYINKKA